jgi:hypothetical protein
VTAGKAVWCVKCVFKEFIAIERTALGGSLQRLVRHQAVVSGALKMSHQKSLMIVSTHPKGGHVASCLAGRQYTSRLSTMVGVTANPERYPSTAWRRIASSVDAVVR